ncbi:uncharacterized protein LOC117611418 [Osmia lignaria lignaria]|uniref:uncharacterized protein LOC117611418 n=1 Tax=Osmia lignaria lignaria TaxID=1437193 RepID=UPI00402BF2E0
MGTDSEATHIAERENFETAYFDLIARVEEYIERASGVRSRPLEAVAGGSATPCTVSDAQPTVKLPTIQLPSFDGDYNDWVRFRDTFMSLIDSNDSMTKVQKFYYLNSALGGSAARVIRSLGVSEANYKLAWDVLKARYENTSALKRHHVNALLDLPTPQKNSQASVREFIDDATNHLIALRALKVSVDAWDPLIVPILSRKLDIASSREWEKRVASVSGDTTFKMFAEFLEERSTYLESVAVNNQVTGNRVETQPQSSTTRKSPRVTSHMVSKTPSCSCCQLEHALANCDKFKKMGVRERTKHVQESQHCFNCLQPGHKVQGCTRNHCKICKRKHHPLLHRDDLHSVQSGTSKKSDVTKLDAATSEVTNSEVTNPEVVLSCISDQNRSLQNAILATAVVSVQDNIGYDHECRILLDSGSQANFITDAFCKKLGLKLCPFEAEIALLGSVVKLIKGKSEIKIRSRHNNFQISVLCYSVKKITDDMPNFPIQRGAILIPSNITLADSKFEESRQIDMLVGSGIFWKLLCVGQQRAGPSLTWQKTHFGWVLGGILTWPTNNTQTTNRCHLVTNCDLHAQLERFWKVEELDSEFKNTMNECEIHFTENTRRDSTGRYIVKIPFLETINNLGDSREQAEKRLRALERRFVKQPELRDHYISFLREYEELEHMTQISESNDDRPAYFLPHHAVSKETSTTTKIRVVFDGSAKCTTGLSLNDVQRIGPVVQNDLVTILIRFRIHRCVLSADITKMYRQILVDSTHRRYQRILWRENPDQPINVYELNTVTYGTASAPFLATRVLRQVGLDNLERYPNASRVIMDDFYVDDLLTGAETPSEIRQLKNELSKILGQSGFPLRKWATNCQFILEEDSNLEVNKELAAEKDPKTLGLIWATKADTLQWSVSQSDTKRVTKRIILSEIAKIFDPLGLVGPVIIQAKILMQRLWQLQTGWDESVSQELYLEWLRYRLELEQLVNIRVPRCTIVSKYNRIELHGFSDASQEAYGACVYLRSEMKPGTWEVRLLCAKSRVAPLRSVSIPRLELCGALILVRLIKKVKESLPLTISVERYWTDSTIVIAWIGSPPNKWKTFVANRVAEIQSITLIDNWSHISSLDNPADIISRGMTPSALVTSTLWWSGPTWLSRDARHWPVSGISTTEVPEARAVKVSLAVLDPSKYSMFGKYSEYSRLLRVVAFCLRFIDRIRNNASLTGGATQNRLSCLEINRARVTIFKLVQEETFHDELIELKRGEMVSKRSCLYSLSPFLDEGGLIRVGGRLVNAPIKYDKRHPIVLPAKHSFSDLVIRYEHIRLLHAGCQQVLASLRESVWLINARNNVRRVVRSCVRCFRVKPSAIETSMGQLPASRVTPARPFMTCGVDYAGPFLTKERTRSKISVKAYICIFVCFATRAVHIELATDLSTEALLNCFRRFIARRGRCKCIVSDNGTNFVGAINEFRDLKILLKNKDHNSDISCFLLNEGIEWKLIPPHAPHFGGLWESAVKSAKYHIKRVIGDQRLTFEELYTFLTQVESCLNSRPISPLSVDPHDTNPLTPGHFLIGDALCALPDTDLRDVAVNRLNRYQLIQQMFQHFWQRWHKEYLHQMQQKWKWRTTSQQQPAVGTLVIIKEDNSPPLRWCLGRVVQTHKGKDGVIRVVTVRTADATYKRPITKICILPIEDNLKQSHVPT